MLKLPLSDPTGGRDPRWRTDIEGSHTRPEVIYCLTRQEGEIHAEEQTSRGHTHVQRSSTVWPDRRERSTLKNRHRGVTHTCRGHLLSDPTGGRDPRWRTDIEGSHTHAEVIYCLTRQEGEIHAEEQTSRGHTHVQRSSTVWPDRRERSKLKNRHRGVTHTSRGHLLSDPTGGRDPRWRTDIEGSHTHAEVIYCLTRQEGEIHAEEQTSRGHTHVQRSSTVWPDRRWQIHAEEQTSRGHTHMQRSSTVWPDRRWEIHAEEQTSRGYTHVQRSSTVWPDRRERSTLKKRHWGVTHTCWGHLLSDPTGGERSTLKNRHRGVTHTCRGHLLSDPTGGRDPRWRTDIEGSHTRPEVIYCLTRQEGEIHAEEQTSRGHTHVQRSSTVWPDRRREIHAEEKTSRGHTHVQRSSTVWPDRRREIHAEEQTSRGHTHIQRSSTVWPGRRERSTLKNRHRGVTHTCRGHLLSDPTGGRDPRWRTDIEGSHTRPEVIYCLTRQAGEIHAEEQTSRGHTHVQRSSTVWPDRRERSTLKNRHRGVTHTSRGHLLSDPTGGRDPRWRTDIEGSHTRPEVIYYLTRQEVRDPRWRTDIEGSHTRPEVIYCLTRQEGEIHAEEQTSRGHTHMQRSSTVWPDRRERSTLKNRHRGVTHTCRGHLLSDPTGGRDPRWRTDIEGSHTRPEVIYCLTRQEGEIHAEEQTSRGHTHMHRHRGVTHTCRGHLLSDPTGGRDPHWRTDIEGSHTRPEVIYCLTRQEGEIHAEEKTSRGHTHVQRSSTVWPDRRERSTLKNRHRGVTHTCRGHLLSDPAGGRDPRWRTDIEGSHTHAEVIYCLTRQEGEIHAEEKTSRGHTHMQRSSTVWPDRRERSTLKNRHRGVTHTCRGHLLSDPTGGRDPRWRTDIEGSHTRPEVIYCLTRQEGEIHAEEQTSRGHTHVQRSSTVWPDRRREIHAEEKTSRGHTHVQRSSTVWPDRRWEIHAEEQTSRGHTHMQRSSTVWPDRRERSTLKNRHRGVTHTCRGHLLSDPTGGRDPRWRTDIEGSHTRPEVIYCLTRQEGEIHAEEQTSRGHTHVQRSSTVWPDRRERSTLKKRHRGGHTHACRGHLLSDPAGGRDPRWRTDIEGSHTHAEVIYCLTRQEGEIHAEEQTSRGHTHVQRSSTVWPDRRREIHAEEQTSRGHTHMQRSSNVWPDRRERSTLKNRHRGVTHTCRGHLLSDPTGERDPRWRTDIEGSHTHAEVIYCLTRQEGEIHAEEQTSRGHTHMQRSSTVWPDRRWEIHAEEQTSRGHTHMQEMIQRSSTVWPDRRWEIHAEEQTSRGHTHVQRSSTVWPDRRERSTLKNRHRGITHTRRGHLLSDPTGERDPRWRTDIEGSHTHAEVIYCLTRQEREIHAEEQTSRGHTHMQRSSTVWPDRRERSTLKNRHRGVTHTCRGHLML